MECVIVALPMLTIGNDARVDPVKTIKEICYGVHWANGDSNYVPPRRLEPKHSANKRDTHRLSTDA